MFVGVSVKFKGLPHVEQGNGVRVVFGVVDPGNEGTVKRTTQMYRNISIVCWITINCCGIRIEVCLLVHPLLIDLRELGKQHNKLSDLDRGAPISTVGVGIINSLIQIFQESEINKVEAMSWGVLILYIEVITCTQMACTVVKVLQDFLST